MLLLPQGSALWCYPQAKHTPTTQEVTTLRSPQSMAWISPAPAQHSTLLLAVSTTRWYCLRAQHCVATPEHSTVLLPQTQQPTPNSHPGAQHTTALEQKVGDVPWGSSEVLCSYYVCSYSHVATFILSTPETPRRQGLCNHLAHMWAPKMAGVLKLFLTLSPLWGPLRRQGLCNHF